MKPDGMLVEPRSIVAARQEVAEKGSGQALEEYGRTEPALAAFIHGSLAAVAGKLSLVGAPSELVRAAHEEVLSVVLTALQALRHGHYELWRDTATGTRLAQLDPALVPVHRRRRRKKGETGSGQDAVAGGAEVVPP
jgi:hypothetical protein